MRTAGGTIFTEGSSPIFADVKNILLPEGTEAKCEFGNLPVGFVPKSVTFLTAEKSDRMTYELAAGRWIKPKVIGAGDKINENDIVELIENNIIEAEISGEDITYVNLRIRRLVTNPVDVRIPVGSFFVSANPAAQNMVATAEKTTRLTTDAWQNIRIPAACANRPKDIPDSNDKFSVQRSPNQEELARLMPALNKSGAGTTTKQAAVWIITDNADYGDLGILVSDPGNVRAIGAVETARAMKICSEAGIDITAKSIWRDRETIISQLQAGELKTWLKKLSEEQTPKVTPVTQTATAKKTFPLKVKYADNDKIIPNTDIYLLYYDEQTSAIVDKIANTGSGNIVEFRIPQNEDGSTYSFVVLLSKTDADKAKTDNNRRMIRIPPGENCTQLQLNIMQNGGMGNEGCAIQMTYK
jgi:hypothetical protein